MANSRAKRNFVKFGISPDGNDVTQAQHKAMVGELVTQTPSAPQVQVPAKIKKHPFMQAVEMLKEEKGIDTDKAMAQIVRTKPDLYKNFMEQSQRR